MASAQVHKPHGLLQQATGSRSSMSNGSSVIILEQPLQVVRKQQHYEPRTHHLLVQQAVSNGANPNILLSETPKSRKQQPPPLVVKAKVNTEPAAASSKPSVKPSGSGIPIINPPPAKDTAAAVPGRDGGTKLHGDHDAIIEIPETIIDALNKRTYGRGRFLGKGGFARCYEVTELKTREIYACKVVSKSLLRKQHQREKMAQEISIHRELSHEFVVKFFSFFEDDLNVYVILELCNRKSLMEMQKRRKTLTEAETRYFLRQIMTGILYLHNRRIIHRDLKLGNIFINEQMNLKLGDFGLATQCASSTSKRYTLCGTPNYIAPEVLSKKGHSFEVDIWSSGCILYTLLLGAPPFETRSLKDTYLKIKKGEYTLPPGKLSLGARTLITQMLQVDPALRPTPRQVLDSDFLTKSGIPKSLPLSVLTMPPRLPPIRAGSERVNPAVYPSVPKEKTLAPIKPNEKTPVKEPPMALPEQGQSKQMAAQHMKDLLAQMKTVLAAIALKPKKPRFNDDSEDPNASPMTWIAKWVDYSDKYGFGYQLSDDSVGVSFNDTSKMLLVPDNNHVQYLDRAGQEHFYTKDRMPMDLQKKMKLLNYFQQYMSENLVKAGGGSTKPDYSMARLPSMWTWFRTSRAVVMVLTNGTLQINNFRDHTKTILCPLLSAITTLEANKPMKTYRFSYLEHQGATQDVADKLTYAIEKLEVVLGSKLEKMQKLEMECELLNQRDREAKENIRRNFQAGPRQPAVVTPGQREREMMRRILTKDAKFPV